MEVLLDAEETEALLDVLRTYGEDLRMEIVDTDNASYKRPLKHRRELIETITAKLHTATATASVASTDAGAASAVGTEPTAVSLRIIAIW